MTAAERLGRTRRMVVAGTVARAVLLAAATGAVVLLVSALLDLVVELPIAVRMALRGAGIAAALVAGAVALRSLRHGAAPSRVALWLEEQLPELRYALVTLAEQPSTPHRDVLERRVAGVDWESASRRAVGRSIAIPAAIAAIASLLLVVIPGATLARVAAPTPGDATTRRGLASEPRSAIERLSVTVHAPAYTGEPPRTLDDPSLVQAIVGSRVELRGRGDAARVRTTVGERIVEARAAGDGWVIALTVGASPLAVVLRDSVASDERVVAVEPRADAIPRVTLESPARDTVMRTAAGRLDLRAQALDDFGLATLRFEWIVSAGEGENFTFRSGATSYAGGNAESRRIEATLSIDSLKLTPGSIVHIRAVARDGNTVSGPGQGVSETRILRIARASEYDSVAIEGIAPPEGDSSALSQRMLIMQTEALEKRRPRLDRPTLLRESTPIARDQIRLRKRVGELVFQRLTGEDSGEHSHEDLSPEELMAHAAAEAGVGPPAAGHGDEAPIVAINQPLLEAYNAMWEAQTHLLLGETKEALPPMYRALEAIQRARAAERLYLRGRPAAVVIDLAKVRLAGSNRPESAGARTARPMPRAQLELERRFERALTIAARDPRAAADSLTLIRLSVVGEGADARPALAAALADAAARLRGTDSAAAEAALRAARRALAGEPRAAQGLARWGSAW